VGHPSSDYLWDCNDREHALCPWLAWYSFSLLLSSSPPYEAITLQVVLTISGESKLAIVVARVPGIDAVGQDMPDRGWLPDVVLARRGGDMRLVQVLGNPAATQALFDQQPIERADDLGLSRLDHDLRRGIVPFQ